MWTLTKRFNFEASHTLPAHEGKCRQLHGHSWSVEIVISGIALRFDGPSAGMLVDFGYIKQVVKKEILDVLDHKHLNDIPGLANPTSEVLSEWIFNRLDGRLPMKAVVIEETATSRCRYEPNVQN